LSAAEAVIKDKKIESMVDGQVFGNDAAAGFDKGWCEIIGINNLITAAGTKDVVEAKLKQFKTKGIIVFEGNYIGVNPFDANDTYDLNNPYIENALQSAPSFNYVLKDVITVE
jgi:basic membrane protein A